jgi:glutaminase
MDNLPVGELNLIETIKNERDFLVKEQLLLELSRYATGINRFPESLTNMFRRNLKFKEYLNSLEIEKDDRKKIIVYTHSCFIQISTSKLAYSLDAVHKFPNDTYKPENCEIITINI